MAGDYTFRLKDYDVLQELGQGGFATVYKVRHKKLGYIRAIRVLNAVIGRGEDDEKYKKFIEECKLLLKVGNGNHPNIVHIYQPLLEGDRALVEMDYVDGMDLDNYLEDQNQFVDIKDVLKLLHDIGSALAYLHEDIYRFCIDREKYELPDDPEDGSKVVITPEKKQEIIEDNRIIHNDIHSKNIIRRLDGNYVLLDFGLAIERGQGDRTSKKEGGMLEYKAPEKWEDDSILTTQSDIYSFGVVLYKFLTGRVPFVPDKKNGLLIAHRELSPQPVFGLRKAAFESTHMGQQYEKDYPDWLEQLIMKCLSKSPDDRFRNGKELYDFVLKNECNDITSLKIIINDQQNKLQDTTDKLESIRIENKTLKKQSGQRRIWMFLFILSLIPMCCLIKANHDLTKKNRQLENPVNSVVNEIFSKRDSLLNRQKALDNSK